MGAQGHIHPFLRGNFAPVEDEHVAVTCTVVHGAIPRALHGGQYIRNGGNPVHPPEAGRHYHWFDGDGMLHGVLFPSDDNGAPVYTNRALATPLLTLTLLSLRSPIPSIALLISPLSSLPAVALAVLQAFAIAVRARMGVLSVANTSVVWWGTGMGSEAAAERAAAAAEAAEAEASEDTQGDDESVRNHRLLATCESGPPLEVRVPGLETVGWDRLADAAGASLKSQSRPGRSWWSRWGLPAVQEDWMTAHPRVDPVDGSFIFYSCQMFDAPHVRYSVIDRHGRHVVWKAGVDVGRAKMMHDFAATRTHTVLLNLPLTLSPANFVSRRPLPLLHFDRALPSEFVVFPRLLRTPSTPHEPVRFVDPEPSLIFHTANAWDEYTPAEDAAGDGVTGRTVIAVNMLGPRFKSAKLVYAAGAVDIPQPEQEAGADDVVRLHYFRFVLPPGYHASPAATDATTASSPARQPTMTGEISHSFPLTAIPFEFPAVSPRRAMQPARFVYGCTMRSGSFDERLGGAAKVDALAKIDVLALVERGRRRGPGKNMTPVDGRTTADILADWVNGNRGDVAVFALPDGMYAQETQFVPVGDDEDDGYLLTYVYDETYLLPDGTPSKAPDAGSELWVIDAKRMGDGMSAVVCRIKLPQRVPYGLHGTYLAPSLSARQRPLAAPLAPQEPLQAKLAKSRLAHFASVLFDRPADRSRTVAERLALCVLWPASIGALALAAAEALGSAARTRNTLAAGIHPGSGTGPAMPLLLGAQQEQTEWAAAFPWPQTVSALLVLALLVGQKVFPAQKAKAD
ncbi:hypothetical protein Q5752_001526 [Cryptotrichosporon argae]